MRRKNRNAVPGGEKRKRSKKNHEMAVVTYIFSGLFALLAVYFVYFEGFLREDVINNPYNSRQELFAERVIRGKILAADGEVLDWIMWRLLFPQFLTLLGEWYLVLELCIR